MIRAVHYSRSRRQPVRVTPASRSSQREVSFAFDAQEFKASHQPGTKGRVARVAGRVYTDKPLKLTTAADLHWAHMRLLQCCKSALGAQAKHQRVASHATAHAALDHEAVGAHHRLADDPFRACGKGPADAFHGGFVVGHWTYAAICSAARISARRLKLVSQPTQLLLQEIREAWPLCRRVTRVPLSIGSRT